MNPLLAAALDYAARGWPVVALHHATRHGPRSGADRARCSCGSTDCRSQGKHPRPRNGFKAATTDPDTLGAMWHRWPSANVGLVTGLVFDVLDVDSIEALDVLDDNSPATAGVIDGRMALTGKGIHVYVEPTGAGGRSGLIHPESGLDWRGRDGYVVAPPSVHYTGVPYEWGPDRGPDREPAPCPGWLLALVLNPGGTPSHTRPAGWSAAPATSAYGRAALEHEVGRLALAVDGTRNEALNRAGYALGQLIAAGELDAADTITALLAAAERWPDLRKSSATIERSLAAGLRSPRRRTA